MGATIYCPIFHPVVVIRDWLQTWISDIQYFTVQISFILKPEYVGFACLGIACQQKNQMHLDLKILAGHNPAWWLTVVNFCHNLDSFSSNLIPSDVMLITQKRQDLPCESAGGRKLKMQRGIPTGTKKKRKDSPQNKSKIDLCSGLSLWKWKQVTWAAYYLCNCQSGLFYVKGRGIKSSNHKNQSIAFCRLTDAAELTVILAR